MKTFKKSFSFIDATGKRARIDAEITTRNKYPEFAASGTYDNSGGQCIDNIQPRTDKQKEFIELWEKYHLTDISKMHNFDEHLEGIISVIEYEEKEREATKEEKTGDEHIIELMEEEGIDEEQLEAVKAYIELMGENLKDFQEAYSGEFASDEEFAQDLADQLGEIDRNAHWPHSCIDWERAANEIMQDYSEQNGYYFRNL